MAKRIKSGLKNVRKSLRKRKRNLATKRAIKEAFKKAERAIASNDPNVKELVKKAVSIVDKAAERGIIHKNKADRKKSRLLKKFSKMGKK